jgi:hypothetical protein
MMIKHSQLIAAALRAALFRIEDCHAECVHSRTIGAARMRKCEAFDDLCAILYPTVPTVAPQYPQDAARFAGMHYAVQADAVRAGAKP